MPAEIRHLIFSEDEAIAALRDYYRRSGTPLPDRAALRLKIVGEDPPSVTLTSQGRCADVIGISGDDLLSALILYCHGDRVPLPVRGSKELTVVKDRLAIVVKLQRRQKVRAA
ncbi:MAG: hypothetical protein JO255_07675 [Alphaproteobacteria bacterium]|nr:hypothetical protein [Alphaproteobacteria bacterium]